MERSCETCRWGKTYEELTRDEIRYFIIELYARGIPYEQWKDYVLCTKHWNVLRRGDDVCEEWEPDVSDVDES